MAAETRKPERSDGFSDERKRLFVVALRMGESVLAACALVGVSNRTAYNHRQRDPGFARAWALARRMRYLPLELTAYERAIGVEEPVYRYGKPSHTRLRYSDALLARLLAAEQPKKYGRRAGLGAERKRLDKRIDKRIDKRVAAETASLREAAAALQAEVEALRTPRKSVPQIVNFMNPRQGPGCDTPSTSRRGRKRRSWRLAAARRRSGKAEISPFPRPA